MATPEDCLTLPLFALIKHRPDSASRQGGCKPKPPKIPSCDEAWKAWRSMCGYTG
jgi:hypothetical protein